MKKPLYLVLMVRSLPRHGALYRRDAQEADRRPGGTRREE